MYKQFGDKVLKKVLNKLSSARFKLILSFIIISSSYSSISQAETTPTEEEVRDAVVQQMMYIEGQRKATKEEIAELVAEARRTSEKESSSEKEEAGGQETKQNIAKKRDAELKQKIPKKIIPIVKEDKVPKMTPLIVSDKQEGGEQPKSKSLNKISSNVTPAVDKEERAKVVTKPVEQPVDKGIPKPAAKVVVSKEAVEKPVEIDFDEIANFVEGLAVEKQVNTASVAVEVDQEKAAPSLSLANEEKLEGRNKALTGWVYLGRFDLGEWENGTLEINKELPEVGNLYFIKASTLNLRSGLPKKGKLGKVTHALKQKEQVKILQLKGSGRNHNYWAEVIRE